VGARLGKVLLASLAYLASCFAFVLVRDRWAIATVVTLVAILATAILLPKTVVTQVVETKSGPLRWLLLLAPLILGLALLLVYVLADEPDGWGFFGLATAYIGAGVLVSFTRRHERVSQWLGAGLVAFCVIALVAGLVGLAPNSPQWAMALIGGAVLLTPAGISIFSESATRWMMRAQRRPLVIAAVIGIVAFGAAIAFVYAFFESWRYPLLLTVAVFAFAVAVAARSNADIAVLLVAVATVWTLANQTTPVEEPLRAEPGERVIVALGDSFTSGEGADSYLQGTNSNRPEDNECRRAPSAYAARIVLDEAKNDTALPDDLVFLACSGAESSEIYEDRPGRPSQLTQLATVLEGSSGVTVDLVVLSLGGNNAGFGSIVQSCLAPGNCAELGPALLANLREIEDDVRNAYRAVREALPGVPVVVVPYPIPFSERRVCDYTPFRDEEHRFVHVFVEALDDVLQQQAEEVGFHFADGVRQAFGTEYRLCDGSTDEVGVNFVDINGVFGTLEHSANPLNWVHNSMHPNDLGHELMQAALSPTLRVVLATPDAPATIAMDSDDAALQEILAKYADGPCHGLTDDDLQDCANDWTLEQTSSFLLKSLPVVILLIGGAWLLALQVIRWWRTRLGLNEPGG
jgi:lysophospholipase L1-like esterase